MGIGVVEITPGVNMVEAVVDGSFMLEVVLGGCCRLEVVVGSSCRLEVVMESEVVVSSETVLGDGLIAVQDGSRGTSQCS